MPGETDFAKALQILHGGTVDFIIVGGVAAILHGLASHSQVVQAFGVSCRRASLERLIQMKRAAGRPKDFEVLGQLQALLEERKEWPHISPEDPL